MGGKLMGFNAQSSLLALSMAVILAARLRPAAWNADDAGLPGHPLANRWHAAQSPASHIAFPAICEALLLTIRAAAEFA